MNRRNVLIGGGSLVAIGVGATLVEARDMGSASAYAEAQQAMRAMLAVRPDAADLVRYATLAPNSHNTQAWRFAIAPGRITILPDFARRTPVVDPDDHHLFVSLGCAAENLSLAAAARGIAGDLAFDDRGAGSIAFAHRPATARSSPLVDAIPRRQSTRAIYDGRTVSVADLKTLAGAAAIPGVDLMLITDRPRMNRIRDLVIAGNSAQLADPAFMAELKSWLRFSPRYALAMGDGLYSGASGSPKLPQWLGQRAFDTFFTAKAENDKYARQLDSSAGVAIFAGAVADRRHWAQVGRACQRFALQATALGLKHAFINQPVEVASFRPELASIAGLPGRRPDIVMRFGYGPVLPYSPRRPVSAVMTAAGGSGVGQT